MSNNIAVSVTADVADLQVKRAIMSAELKAATKDLNEFAKEATTSGSTEALREGMLASATAAEKARAGIASINAELKTMVTSAAPAVEHVEHGFAGISVSVREMGVQVRESVGMIGEMREAMVAFGEAMIAAFALERIAEWGKEFAEQAEKVHHLSEEFGMTTQQVQGLGVVARLAGVSIDTITKAMGILDKNMFAGGQKASLFKQLGVDAETAKDQVALLATVADKFKNMDDGPKKAALAMELFGRAGKDMIPILNEGGDAIREAGEKAKEYGAAYTELSDSAQAKGAALAESINETGVAWQGVTNVLGDAFAPILKEVTDSIDMLIKSFVDSYREGGTVAVIFGVIAGVIEIVGSVIDAVIGVFSELWTAAKEIVSSIAQIFFDLFGVQFPKDSNIASEALNDVKMVFIVLKDTVIIVVEIIRGYITVLADFLRTFARVVNDAFHLDWAAIDGEWKAGTERMAKDVETSAKRIVAAMAEAKGAVVAAYEGKPVGGHGKTGIEGGGGGGNGTFDPTMGGGKHKKGKDDLVQRLDAQLTAKKLAWAKEQDARDTAIAFSLQAEADYWAKILERTDLNAKDRAAIETKYLAVRSQILKQKWADEEAGYKADLDRVSQNEDAKLDLVRQHTVRVGEFFGQQSTEFKRAKEEEVKEEQRAQAQLEEIERIHLQRKAAHDEEELAEIRRVAQFRVQMGVETEQQLLEEDRKAAAARYAIITAELQKEMEAAQKEGNSTAQAQIVAKQLAARQAYQNQLTEIDRKAILQRTTLERTAITSTAQLWSSNIAKLITLQQGFAATLKGLYQGMVQIVSKALATILEQWLVKHISTLLLGRAASSAAAVAQVTSAVGLAGANGVASFAAAPWPIDMGAPAFGASMAAAAAAFAPAASAAGGWWDVPSDTTTRIHAREMVLPAWAAQPLRSMLGGGAANSNSPAAANDSGGDFHYHDHTGTMTPAQIHANRDAFAKAMIMAHREGKFSRSPLGR